MDDDDQDIRIEEKSVYVKRAFSNFDEKMAEKEILAEAVETLYSDSSEEEDEVEELERRPKKSVLLNR